MFKKTFIVWSLVMNGILPAAAETINLSIKKEIPIVESSEIKDGGAPTVATPPPVSSAVSTQTLMQQFTLKGFNEAITKALTEMDKGPGNGLEEFWENVKLRGFDTQKEIAYLASAFSKMSFSSLPVVEEHTDAMAFNYEIDTKKLKNIYYENVKSQINYASKIIFIDPEITIDETMNWEDLGVAKKENFTDVIVDSWAKWAQEKFQGFERVVILKNPMTKMPEDLNAESVTLKWNSNIKKIEVFHERKVGLFEVDAQYVLVNTKLNQNLVAFDFPTQKKEFSLLKEKELSSNLASLVYNLLNSQTLKIQTALELNKAQSSLNVSDFSVSGDHGLVEITQITNLLNAKYKAYALDAELKQYSRSLSKIAIKSMADQENLNKVFSLESEKLKINDHKYLRFDAPTSTFFIEEETSSSNNKEKSSI